jgi:hypothetical protein
MLVWHKGNNTLLPEQKLYEALTVCVKLKAEILKSYVDSRNLETTLYHHSSLQSSSTFEAIKILSS